MHYALGKKNGGRVRKITLRVEATVVVLVDDCISMDDLVCELKVQSEDLGINVIDSTIDDYVIEDSR